MRNYRYIMKKIISNFTMSRHRNKQVHRYLKWSHTLFVIRFWLKGLSFYSSLQNLFLLIHKQSLCFWNIINWVIRIKNPWCLYFCWVHIYIKYSQILCFRLTYTPEFKRIVIISIDEKGFGHEIWNTCTFIPLRILRKEL